MANKDFEKWISCFKESLAEYRYYVDFQKIISNAEEIKIELNLLNSLIGSKKIRQDFIALLKKYPDVIKCIPILIAVRSEEIKIFDSGKQLNFNFKSPNYSIEEYADFMEKIGLFDMISNRITNSLYDYVLGVETGLDSNGRKNRGGHLMEDLVEKYLKKTGKEYFKEMTKEEIEKKYGIDLSSLQTKRFDFVLEGDEYLYGIEVNFYTGGGSKLNETARSYKEIGVESQKLKNFRFVWITDGKGWLSAKKNLKDTFDVMEHIYSLEEIKNGALKKLLRMLYIRQKACAINTNDIQIKNIIFKTEP